MSEGLSLRFTRLAADRCRLEYRRADGTGETIELESGGAVVHDLMHYAVESEAGLRGSFWGILAKIGGYEELVVAGGAALGGEIAITERVVGALTAAMQEDDLDADAFAGRVTETLQLYDERPPRWLTPAFIAAARERTRQLLGNWKATPVGAAMELAFQT